MKIVLLNTFETNGGAAIACKRLMTALQKNGIDVKLVVRDKSSNDPNVISVNTSFLKRKINFVRFVWERLIIFINNRFNKKNLFAVSIANTGTNISKLDVVKEADIIHIHWVNQGFLSIKNIEQLANLGKPIVWTMHDMWPITGICHHAQGCTNFMDKCGSCFFLESAKKNDLSQKILLRKQKTTYSKSFIFIGCSYWIANKAKQSSLAKKSRIISIPNPIDSFIFKKSNPTSRANLGLPENKRLILFGALNIADKRKGIDYLSDALKHLKTTQQNLYEQIELVVFGKVKEDVRHLFDIPIHAMGYLESTEKIVELYNAVDLFVSSSLEENLPNTIMEAMACGVPCVGFNTGGIPEMINHKENGFVAEYKSAEHFAKGIFWTLYEADYSLLSKNARQKAVNSYSEEIVAKQYIELYNKIVD